MVESTIFTGCQYVEFCVLQSDWKTKFFSGYKTQ